MAEKKKAVRKPRTKPVEDLLDVVVTSPQPGEPLPEPLPAEVVSPAAAESLPPRYGMAELVLDKARDAWPKHFWGAVATLLVALAIQTGSLCRWAGAIDARVSALETRMEKIEKAVYRP